MNVRVVCRAPNYILVFIENFLEFSYTCNMNGGQIREICPWHVATWIEIGISHPHSLVSLHKEEEIWIDHQKWQTLQVVDNSSDDLNLDTLSAELVYRLNYTKPDI